MKTLRSILTFVLPFFALIACAPPEPVRIGYLGGLSGRVSDLGIGGLQGARLAIELRNKAGGIKGQTIELIEADDQQDPDAARKAFDALAARRVAAIVGPMTSAMAIAIVHKANESKLLVMSPTVTTGDLLGIDDYFFRVIPATNEFVDTNADYFFRAQGLRRLRLIYDLHNKSYTESWLTDFTKLFADAGGTLLPPLSFFSSDEADFHILAKNALAGNPEGIIIIANSVDAAGICHAIRLLNSKIRLGTSEWAATERLAEIGGKWVEGITVAQFFDRDSRAPAYLNFRAAYQSRFSREPGFPETFSFDATNVILDAIESQTQNPGQSLKEIVLARQQFNGVQRPITFDRNGDTLGKTFMVRIENGAFAPIRK